MSDVDIDTLEAALDAGEAVDEATMRKLIIEERGSRRSLGLAARAMGALADEAGALGIEARRVINGAREAALSNGGAGELIIAEWPQGFGEITIRNPRDP